MNGGRLSNILTCGKSQASVQNIGMLLLKNKNKLKTNIKNIVMKPSEYERYAAGRNRWRKTRRNDTCNYVVRGSFRQSKKKKQFSSKVCKEYVAEAK